MEGDFFINNILYACSETSGYIVSGFLLERIGLRAAYLSSFAICFIGAGLYFGFRSSNQTLVSLSLLLSNLGTAWGLNNDWNANAMLFPVIYSSSTNGFCNMSVSYTHLTLPTKRIV